MRISRYVVDVSKLTSRFCGDENSSSFEG